MEAGTVAPAAASTGSKTIADMLALAAERHGTHEAQRYKRDGEWQSVSYEELGRTVSEIARGLIDLGIEPGERVSLLCATRREWTSCDFAISSAGAVVVPIYPTNSPERVRVGGGELRVGGDRVRGRRAGGQDRRGAREPARAPPHDRRGPVG